jgi:hypothetical protein
VKSVRGQNYIFFDKRVFEPRPNLLAALVIYRDGQAPAMYLIPSEAWQSPNALLVDRDYIGLKSKPEYGVNLSRRNQQLLDQYGFDKVARTLVPPAA